MFGIQTTAFGTGCFYLSYVFLININRFLVGIRYGRVCLLVLRFEPSNGLANGLTIFEFLDERQPMSLPQLKCLLKFDLFGLVGVQVVDNLVLVHHKVCILNALLNNLICRIVVEHWFLILSIALIVVYFVLLFTLLIHFPNTSGELNLLMRLMLHLYLHTIQHGKWFNIKAS